MTMLRLRMLCICGAILLSTGCERPEVTASQPATVSEPTAAATQSAPTATPAPEPAPETDVAAAVDVIIDYYAAIDARDYQRAYQHWGQSGLASGKSFEEFAAGFRDTARVTVAAGTPGRIDPAAGSRYISIPVVVTAVTDQGRQQRFAGTYNLRRTVVDGATEAQRRWHFYSAALRETKPDTPPSRP